MVAASRGLFVLGLVCLAGCQPLQTPAPQPKSPPPTSAEAPVAETSVDRGTRYAVAPAQSELRILVFRAGALAKLGHNHVIVHRAPEGEIFRREGGGDFRLVIPVTTFEVDPPAARAAEGPEFASVPDADAKAGTRANMLGDEVLDAARFPAIRAEGTLVDAAGQTSVNLALTLKDRTTPLRVPVTIREDAGALVATGQLRIQQSELGLRPFTALGGLLAVDEDITIRFRITARRAAPRS